MSYPRCRFRKVLESLVLAKVVSGGSRKSNLFYFIYFFFGGGGGNMWLNGTFGRFAKYIANILGEGGYGEGEGGGGGAPGDL